jgi:hypothetical protein
VLLESGDGENIECTWDERARIQQEKVRAHREDIEAIDNQGQRDNACQKHCNSGALKSPHFPFWESRWWRVAGGGRVWRDPSAELSCLKLKELICQTGNSW